VTVTNPSAEYFDRVADRWDSLRSGYFTEAVRHAAIARAYLHPEMVVADVGAGTGFLTAGLAPLVRRVHVIDGAQAMLDVARKNLAAFANMYLHHCPDPLAAIQEMVRTLRPGGRLVLTDMDAHDHAWLKEEMADVWLGFDRAQLRDWFEQAGLVNVIVDCTGEACQAECQGEAQASAAISIFVATATKRVRAREAVQAAYAARALGAACGCSDSSCCTPDTIALDEVTSGGVRFDGGYSPDETASIPSEAAEISLGCGNPTAMANLRPGEAVLDIGSGGGIDAFLAAQRVGPTGRVLGVDMTPAMLQRARRAAEAGGYANVTFRHGYAESLPAEDASVDVILSNCVINLAEDKAAVFREAFRVLRPGGRLEINDMVFGGAVLPSLRTSAEGWSECISGALPESEYLDLVKQAGFVDVTARRSTSAGEAAGVPVYSVQVSGKKPLAASD
jgi:arsenite methyltransferase